MSDLIKLLVLGDGAVGKSCLLISYNTNHFPSEYVPTVFDNYATSIKKDGKDYSVSFWDTAGQEDYDRLRPLSYPGTDIFLLCYSVDSRASLDNIQDKWLPEIKHFMASDLPPILMVACKTDLRSSSSRDTVTYDEGYAVAKKCNLPYVETSALAFTGLTDCFERAVELAVLYRTNKKSSKLKKGLGFGFKKNKKEEILPPIMPPAGKAPYIEIETSTFAEQWKKMLDNPQHTDMIFVVENQYRIKAHSIIIAAASELFCRILKALKPDSNELETSQLQRLKENPITSEMLAQGEISGIRTAFREIDQDKTGDVFIIEMDADIKSSIFAYVLEYLYTGVPHFKEQIPDEEVENLKNISKILELGDLERICENQLKEEDFLNPSIGTYLNDQTGQILKKRYFNQTHAADIVFKCQGEKIYAHRSVLSARCDVMAAMFSGQFKEGSTLTEIEIYDTSAENFLALLEYLYTDHAPIEEGDAVGIMVVADQFGVTRLISLCELYITFEIDRKCIQQIEKSEINVIGLLLGAQCHNGNQLANWCLHFISSNYQAFKGRSEFCQLTDSNLVHVEEHQWPPVSYLTELEEYERKIQKQGSESKCVMM